MRKWAIILLLAVSLLSFADGPTNVNNFYARGTTSVKTLISISTNYPSPATVTCTTNALAVNLLTATATTANAGTYATASFTPTTNAFLFAAISGSPTGTETVTNTGSTQLVWWRTSAGKTNYNTAGSPAGFTALYVSQLPQGLAPFSMTVVVNQASGTGRNIIVGEVTGADQSAQYGTNAVVQVVSFASTSANPTNLFAAPGNGGENTLIFVVADDVNSGSDNAPTLSWTELWETNYNTPAHALAVYYSNNVPSSVTTATNTASSRDWATIVMEVKAGTVGCNLITANATTFDGTNDQLSRGADLSSNADGKTGTLSVWVKRGAAGTTQDIMCNSGLRFEVWFDSDNKIRINGYNTGGSSIMDMRSVNAYSSTTTWYHILADWDLAANAKNLYVNDVSDLTSPTFTNDTLDYTRADWFIGANDASAQRLNGCLSEVYLHVGTRLDFSVSSNRRKFDDGGSPLKPVDLGSNGSTPTGSQPILYLKNAFGTFQNNAGSGGNFSVTGSLTDCTAP